MSINIRAKLVVKKIHGRHGEFNVGTLLSDIGEFTVKDKSIEELSEGSFKGNFVVTEIFSGNYSVANRLIIETRARIESYQLDEVDVETESNYESLEKDPIEEEEESPGINRQAKETAAVESNAETYVGASEESNQLSIGTKDDEKLFGILWPIGERVKLDATVNRALLRDQVQRLNVLGYELDAIKQEWNKKEVGGQ